MTRHHTLAARCAGSMLGAAYGDSLGAPTEFMRWPEIAARYGEGGITALAADNPFGPGAITDDTQMALAVAAGLLEAHTPGTIDLGEALARHFARWWAFQQLPGEARAPGGTCLAAGRLLADGVGFEVAAMRAAAGELSKGAGATMRVHPVGLVYGGDLEALQRAARLSASITHPHPAAAAAAYGQALLVAYAAAGDDPADIARELPHMMAVEGEEGLGARLQAAVDLHDVSRHLPTRQLLNAVDPDGGWTADGALALVVATCLRHGEDWHAGVVAAANIDGDSDTVAAMVGAVLGAAHPDQVQARAAELATLEQRRILLAYAAGLAALAEEMT